jgi:hypothetical protein
MKISGMKIIQELEGEFKLISVTEETWAIWLLIFDAHNNGNFVNLERFEG